MSEGRYPLLTNDTTVTPAPTPETRSQPTKTAHARLTAVAMVLAALSGCQARALDTPLAPSAASTPAVHDAPSVDELRNATYRGFAGVSGAVTLTDGTWAGPPVVESGAARSKITFVRTFRLAGDVDGDGQEEAVVLLSEATGGSGELLHLAVVDRSDGRPRNVATALLGDRVQVRDAGIEARGITLQTVEAGPGDAVCCPGELVTRHWALQGGVLREVASRSTGRLSLQAIDGADWVLRHWAWDEGAPVQPEVTLRFDGGRFVGRSGCNSYVAPVHPGIMPGAISLGPVARTRMRCPSPAQEIEERFLQQLGAVTRIVFVAGQLGLSCQLDGRADVMLFDRRPQP